MIANNNTGSLYPLDYNGKRYYEKDCDELFAAVYNSRDSLVNGGVYICDGFTIYPDGSANNNE